MASETQQTARRHWLWNLGYLALKWVAVPYCVVVALLVLFENRLVYPAFNTPGDDWNPADLEIEEVRFTSTDGTKLHGWFVPRKEPKAVVLYLHGNGGNITHRLHRLHQLHDMGAAVFIFDYRGYGKSEGSPHESGLLQDGRAARHWLSERTGMAETKFVLLGESIGGGVAVDLASKEGAAGLILESTFTSLPDASATHYPWVPVHLLMRNRYHNLSKLPSYHGPLLISHGDQDDIIPYSHGEQLFQAAHQPKTFFPIPGATHNNRASLEYDLVLEKFLHALPPPKVQAPSN